MGGLLVALLGMVGLLARRTGRDLRLPTPSQRDDIAKPVGRILHRHLPAGVLTPDLFDAAIAVSATHDYLMDGPLVTTWAPAVDLPDPDQED